MIVPPLLEMLALEVREANVPRVRTEGKTEKRMMEATLSIAYADTEEL